MDVGVRGGDDTQPVTSRQIEVTIDITLGVDHECLSGSGATDEIGKLRELWISNLSDEHGSLRRCWRSGSSLPPTYLNVRANPHGKGSLTRDFVSNP
jgi:hypothetical protein